jgi:hypothetical protein
MAIWLNDPVVVARYEAKRYKRPNGLRWVWIGGVSSTGHGPFRAANWCCLSYSPPPAVQQGRTKYASAWAAWNPYLRVLADVGRPVEQTAPLGQRGSVRDRAALAAAPCQMPAARECEAADQQA